MRKKVDKTLQNLSLIRIEELCKSDKPLTNEDIKNFNEDDIEYVVKYLRIENEKSKDDKLQRDFLFRKFYLLYTDETKNNTWHRNHVSITIAYSNLLNNFNRMPTIAEVVNKCNLSRQTVFEHLKEFDKSPYFNEINQQFKIIAYSVLEKMAIEASKGNVKAGRLFLEATGNLKQTNQPPPSNNKNYIQLNDCTINLNEEQSKKILELLEKKEQ